MSACHYLCRSVRLPHRVRHGVILEEPSPSIQLQ
jgi:hypothetical protein